MTDQTTAKNRNITRNGTADSRGLKVFQIRSLRILIDASLVIAASLLYFTDSTVIFFHIIFVLLTLGAFYFSLRSFAIRAAVWVTVATLFVLEAVRLGETQAEELIEIPLLTVIMLLVFAIATRRSISESRADRALADKEALLSEVHHRVKNNLQVTSSLLNLQSRNLENEEALRLLKTSRDRIQSMALVHETLYQSKNFAEIEFDVYVRKLIADLFSSFGVSSDDIDLKLHIDHASLDLDEAVPCGLIINELVTNSLKHAFASENDHEIRVDFRSEHENQITLVVRDNGCGYPNEFDIRHSQSLGMKLVQTLADQLGGTLKMDNTGGAACEIAFQSRLKT